MSELKLLERLDGMVVETLEHLYFQGYRHGRLLVGSNQVRRLDSKLCRTLTWVAAAVMIERQWWRETRSSL